MAKSNPILPRGSSWLAAGHPALSLSLTLLRVNTSRSVLRTQDHPPSLPPSKPHHPSFLTIPPSSPPLLSTTPLASTTSSPPPPPALSERSLDYTNGHDHKGGIRANNYNFAGAELHVQTRHHYTPKLIALMKAKGGVLGTKLRPFLEKLSQEDSRSDATEHVLKILVVHGANGEDPSPIFKV
ncbi:hypothetical protein F7725_026044 [Dissostichus mawsoni]|uniref:Uncharacterized protein n=1 Tax=Dissostichus mawsoni TaxID=36200 RepID=A0A7J5X6W4_DISMA|nr:hypothetical protein F7725_026044 [Dissostichus mawsoni]